jgi:hypothetical protein
MTQRATYIPSQDAPFRGTQGTFAFAFTPMLDPTNKATAARIESHLIAVRGTAEDAGLLAAGSSVVTGPGGLTAAGVLGVTALAAGTLAVPMHYLQLPDEPPDPHYAEVFRPRIPKGGVTATGSRASSAALRRLNRSDSAIDGLAGAEWNTLNRSVIARERNNRAAFVTQMLAASKDETKLAALVSKLPAEMRAVERSSLRKVRTLSIRVSKSQLAELKRKTARLSASQKRYYKSIGLKPSLVASLIATSARHVTASSLHGKLFPKLNAAVAAEAASASFLRRVAAIHAAMAFLYS